MSIIALLYSLYRKTSNTSRVSNISRVSNTSRPRNGCIDEIDESEDENNKVLIDADDAN